MIINNSCIACDPICYLCNISSTNCLSCKNGYILFGTNCVTQCPVNNYYLDSLNNICKTCQSPCLNCQSIILCTSCLTGYLSNNSCVSVCPIGYYANNLNNDCTICKA